MRKITVEQMRQHIEQLCDQHNIAWCKDMRRNERAHALWELDEIHTPPVRGRVSYAVALHELGHFLGRYQKSRRCIVQEGWAWRWARSHALIWTPAMERHMQWALDWYRRNGARIDRTRARWPTVTEQLNAALAAMRIEWGDDTVDH